jgi:hypothetical protein
VRREEQKGVVFNGRPQDRRAEFKAMQEGFDAQLQVQRGMLDRLQVRGLRPLCLLRPLPLTR